jgi:hypothetical protein
MKDNCNYANLLYNKQKGIGKSKKAVFPKKNG